MQLSAIFVSLSVMLASVAAAPTSKETMDMSQKTVKGNGATAGAAYFITNEPSGNFIVTADIKSDGKLALVEAVSTRGVGSHGKVDADGPDPLFSQGSIKASANGKMLAAVNPGSNTVSLFSIDAQQPARIQMLGQPMSSGGEFPMSVAFNKAGDKMCVLNGGQVNGVKCFTVDAKKGLVGISDSVRSLELNQTTPATGPAGSASHILFNEDGSQLVASVKGVPPTPGFIAVWDVVKDGSLSKAFKAVPPPKGGALPFGMNFIPGKNALLATDPASGFDIIDLSGQANSTIAAAASTAVNVTGQVAVCWTSHSKKTGNFYLTDIGTSMVTEVSVDDNLKPTIVKQFQQAAGSATIDTDIASIGANDFLYILAPNATQVQVMSLDAPGKATSLQTIDISAPAKRAGLSINAFNLQGMTTFVKV